MNEEEVQDARAYLEDADIEDDIYLRSNQQQSNLEESSPTMAQPQVEASEFGYIDNQFQYAQSFGSHKLNREEQKDTPTPAIDPDSGRESTPLILDPAEKQIK